MVGLTDYDLSLKRPHSMIFEMNPDPMVALALCAPEVKVKEFAFWQGRCQNTVQSQNHGRFGRIIWKTKTYKRRGYTVIAIGRTGTPRPNYRTH